MDLLRRSSPAAPAGFTLPLHQSHPEPAAPPGRRPLTATPAFHVLLFLLTLISVTAAGAMQRGVNPFTSVRALVHLVEGVPFAATLLGILAVHEFGHYFAARSWGVHASLPYFVPLPYVSFLGTLGAVIKIRTAIPHRRALLDIGAAGPLAGFVVAVAACVVGLLQSQLVTLEHFRPGSPIHLGAPLLFRGLSWLLLPVPAPDQYVLLSPVAFAGWVGLFITAFNLFPVGQLDGGHVVYALFGRTHGRIARAFFLVLLVMGLYGILSMIWDWPPGWPGWLVLAIFLTLLGRDHPPPVYEHIRLGPGRRVIGYLCLVVFGVCVAPVPFAYSG